MAYKANPLDLRITFLLVFLFCVFIGIVLRLFYWQIIKGDSLRLTASLQRDDRKNIPAIRGDIVCSDGSPLAQNKTSYLAFAEPDHIEDKNDFSIRIAPIIGKKPEDVRSLIANTDKKWVPLVRGIDIPTKKKLESLRFTGLGFDAFQTRYYPEASMAAHVLGFVAQDADGKDKGYFGLEGYYDRELSGQDGSMRMERDAKGAPILIGESTIIEPKDGRTLVLWLDRSVQFIAEKRLKEGLDKYGAKGGSIVILNPQSGGVLAMASYPNYDPAHFSDYPEEFFTNPAVASSYEPGSTFKPLIVAAAVNERLISSDTKMDEDGPVTIGEYTVKTWNDEYHGPITMTQILQYSSNVGMVFIQDKLGKDKTLRYIKEYGFGEKTQIDLEDESSPDLRPPSAWYDIDYATASFGQGIAATPLQVLRAIATIANHGWLMEPKMVKELHDKNGKVTILSEKRLRRVISEDTAKTVTNMMVDAVSYGEAKWAKPKGYKVAGKTGTAQVPVAGHYDKDKTIASFVGFAPADDPKFIMLVTLTEPQSSIWGSETAAPLFFAVAKDLFAYFGISPSP